MFTITQPVTVWSSAGPGAATGVFAFALGRPIIGGSYVVTAREWPVTVVDGILSTTVPAIPPGNFLRIRSLIEGMRQVWYVLDPGVSAISLSDLIAEHSVDPSTLYRRTVPASL